MVSPKFNIPNQCWGSLVLISCVDEFSFWLRDGAVEGADGFDPLGDDGLVVGDGFFARCAVGNEAGESWDFDEEGVVLLAPVDDEFVAHVSGFYAAAKSRSRVARTEGVGSFSSLDRRCSISSRTVTQRLA